MRGVYLLSTCEKVIAKKAKYLVYFHFRGVYLGQKISLVAIEAENELKKGCNYFLYIEVIKVSRECLIGRLMKFKTID